MGAGTGGRTTEDRQGRTGWTGVKEEEASVQES